MTETTPHDTNRLRTLLTACLVLLLVLPVSMTVAPGFVSSPAHDGIVSAAEDHTVQVTIRNETGSVIDTLSITVSDDDIKIGTGIGWAGRMTGGEADPADDERAWWDNATFENGTTIEDFENANLDYYNVTTDGGTPFGLTTDASHVISGTQALEFDSTNDNEQLTRIISVNDTEIGTYPKAGDNFTVYGKIKDEDRVFTTPYSDVLFGVHENETGGFQIRISPDPDTSIVLSGGGNSDTWSRGSAVEGETEYYQFDVSWSGPSQEEPQTKDLELLANDYMQPGTSQDYTVEFTEGDTVTDVTDNVNTSVTSNNSTLVAVDTVSGTLSSSTDENETGTARINATFTDSDDVTHNDSVNVTVSQATMKNFDILPSAWRINALFGFDMGSGDQESDTLPLMILIAIFAGGITARVVSPFAGIGAMLLIIIVGWFGGWVGTGVVLSALFVGLFIGFNLAANIDYSVRR